jgi:hypothetical protein
VCGNTKALERQVLLDRASNVAAPFMERCGMEPQQAVAWSFSLYKIWNGYQADHLYAGPSEHLAAEIRSLLSFPDNQVYWSHSKSGFTAEFREYVKSVSAGLAPAETPSD